MTSPKWRALKDVVRYSLDAGQKVSEERATSRCPHQSSPPISRRSTASSSAWPRPHRCRSGGGRIDFAAADGRRTNCRLAHADHDAGVRLGRDRPGGIIVWTIAKTASPAVSRFGPDLLTGGPGTAIANSSVCCRPSGAPLQFAAWPGDRQLLRPRHRHRAQPGFPAAGARDAAEEPD
jgi:hypothetical protein